MLRQRLIGMCLGLTALVMAAPAAAQTKVNLDIAASYTFLKLEDPDTFPFGWNVSMAAKPTEHVHVIWDVSGHYGNKHDLAFVHSFTGGVRIREPHLAQVIPFAQATFGRSIGFDDGENESSWLFQAGGGIDIPFEPDYLRPNGPAFRFQVDFPYYFGDGRSTTGLRYSVGVVVPIK